jgi:hypothetical protein
MHIKAANTALQHNDVIEVGMTRNGQYVAEIPAGKPRILTAPTEAELREQIKQLNPVSGMRGIKNQLLKLISQIQEGGRRKNRSQKARKAKKSKRTRRN